MNTNERVEIAISLLKAIVGEGWNITHNINHIDFTYVGDKNLKSHFVVMIRDWADAPTFDLTVGCLSDTNDPTIVSNYKAIGALMSNPCIGVVKELLS